MKKFKIKKSERILAALLAFVMGVCLLPSTVFAAIEINPNLEVNENIVTPLTESIPSEVKLSVNKIGNGTVKINNVEVEGTDTTVEKDSTIKIEITPDNINDGKTYIKYLKIGTDEDIPVEKYKSYTNDAFIITEDTEIEVEFTTEFTITASAGEGGTIELNGGNEDSLELEEGSKLNVLVTPGDGYQIASVKFDEDDQEVTDVSKFSEEITVTKNMNVTATFVKLYTITVKHNKNGTVVIKDPVSEVGEVTVTEGEYIEIKATPSENYRVAKVVKNGETFDYTNNDENYKDTILDVNEDYSYEITFALNTYNVTSGGTINGTVVIENGLVEHGKDTVIKLIPESDLYRIEKITIRKDSEPKVIEIGKESEKNYIEQADGSAVYTLEKITEDTVIEVKFEKIPVVDGDWKAKISITPINGEFVKSYTDNHRNEVYVYLKKDNLEQQESSIKIEALSEYDMVNVKLVGNDKYEGWTKEATIPTNCSIEALQVKTEKRGNEGIINLDNKKIIIATDETAPEVTLKPEPANENGYYNKDVNVKIEALDPDYYSGIEKVEYWVKSDGNITQYKTIYVNKEATYKDKDIIIVDVSKNNSDNVEVIVKVTDASGNATTKVEKLKINTTKPVVSISIDGTLHSEAKTGYYNSDRKATIIIVDRAGSFDETAVLNGLSITAKDIEGNVINVSKSAMLSAWSHSGDEHTAILTFSEEANYEWGLSYTNKADLTNDAVSSKGESIYNFTIDKTAPNGEFKLYKVDKDNFLSNRTFEVLSGLISKLIFRVFGNYPITSEAEASDLISPIYDVKYYKSNSTETLSKEDLISLYNDGEFGEEKFTVHPDELFAVYAKITDYAGNTLYIGTDGVIVDNTVSKITLTPDEPNNNGFYNKDVNVSINVNDNVFDEKTYSGIKTVDYTVESNGKVTQSGNLYTFDKSNPTYDEITKDLTRGITVDSSINNDDHVIVTVIAYDNAGVISEEDINLSINIDKPIVNVSFNDIANKVVEDNGYFGAKREATIQITDRASAFDSEAATKGIVINAVDAKGKKVELDTSKMISKWSSDGNIHTATITFEADGNYTWSFDYTNKADNQMKPVKAEGTTPFNFTVDKTNPTGTISVDENIWDKLLNILTFGLYSNKNVQVKATSEDATSPVVIEYYKTRKSIAMTAEELDNERFETYSDFSVEADEQFVVYLKITDYAGNYIYINSDGYIVDKTESNITLTPDQANENGIYNKDVNVSIKVIDPEPYSGIKTIDYWIVKDNDTESPTQQGNLYTFTKTNPTQAELKNEWDGNIIVDSKKNNSCNVVVFVRTIDNAGNENIKSIPLDIDITSPEIKVAYDNNKDNNGNTYFNNNRTATITIKERTHHFDEKEATEGIIITAIDSKGNKVDIDTSKIISNWTTVEGDIPESATHTATIEYSTDANYTFAISYVDKADNANRYVDTGNSVAPYKFTVDKNAPTGTIKAVSEEGREKTWNELVDSLTFGFWSGKKIALTGTSDDVTSPIESVEYYKIDSVKALTETELKTIVDWKKFDEFSVMPNEQFTVYLKIIDKAGNVTYISTDGMIVDNTSPREEVIAPEITTTPEQPINGLYNRDVKVAIKVDDPLVGGTYSGLKTVSYRVLNMGKETQSGTLYSFNKSNPSRDELLKTWTGEITVDSTKNNSNDVVIEIYAEDNSLNSSKDKVSIKIDITTPTIDIKYNNNSADSGKYYKEDRVATVVVTERNFNAEDVKIAITNTDGTIPTISDWKQSVGSGNEDNTTHTATITYKVDGDYTFKIEYTDLANNKCVGENYETGTTNPKEFTIDKTLPEVSVSYDNNSAQNGKYFKANRTATIVVKEHNFDVSRVEFTQTASKNGASITVPSARWSSNGDVHTAIISYGADGDYTFDVKMKDMAGNNSSEANYGGSVAAKDFTVDTDISEPEITGVENGKAYKDDVIPGINFSDINYSDYQVRLTRTRMSEKDVDVTKEFIKTLNVDAQGGSGTNDTFKKEQENDGIYTLYVKVNDKAGNESEKTVNFTVNRYGSVYEYSDYLISLISNGGAYVRELDNDLVITEYNADNLLEDSLIVEITRDGKPIEGIKYNVSPEINNQVAIGSSGWFQYQYTISKENFSEDGVYKMSIASKDATGNAPENTNYKDKSILFRVDSTAPELTSVVGLEKNIVNAQEVTVNYTVFDTIALKSINIYVNGQQQGDAITDFASDMNNYSGSFVINESNSEQKVRIVVEDMAGNVTDTSSDDFTSAYVFEKAITVSTNTFVRWYANKLLFWGSIVGSLVLAAGIWYTIYGKKKVKVEVEENK